MRLRYLDQARDDLVAIARWVARESGSPESARRLTLRLRSRCAALAAHPFMLGSARPELGQDLRSYAVGRYVILFRYRHATLEVVTIIEGHRDIARLMADRPGEA